MIDHKFDHWKFLKRELFETSDHFIYIKIAVFLKLFYTLWCLIAECWFEDHFGRNKKERFASWRPSLHLTCLLFDWRRWPLDRPPIRFLWVRTSSTRRRRIDLHRRCRLVSPYSFWSIFLSLLFRLRLSLLLSLLLFLFSNNDSSSIDTWCLFIQFNFQIFSLLFLFLNFVRLNEYIHIYIYRTEFHFCYN